MKAAISAYSDTIHEAAITLADLQILLCMMAAGGATLDTPLYPYYDEANDQWALETV